MTPGVVERLRKAGDIFEAHGSSGSWKARTILLATGVVNNHPKVDPEIHDVALAQGLLRYCPICDSYEVTDRRVAVIGTDTHDVEEAIFIRTYTSDVTLIAPNGEHVLTAAEREKLGAAGINIYNGPCGPLGIEDKQICIPLPAGAMTFDAAYPALGSIIQSELAIMLGAEATSEGCLTVNSHQRTTVDGLRGRRCGQRARPDQPCHGQSRRGGDLYPQRPC